ncbi:MAG: glutamate 5-kinase [Fretibacterium sp.]|nr:glutamate 5-kinase [Fretibacterium sp.]
MDRKCFQDCKRLVVKVGTSSITYPTGKINLGKMELMVRELSDLHNSGRELILVSSGAVGAGIGKLGSTPTSMPQKQAIAAVGQGLLMQMYEKLFSEYSKCIAQVLLTRDCFSNPARYMNSRNTIFALLEYGVIPIVNENDTVAVEELKFGDNDRLSAMVACNAEADLLIVLSDIDGLYDSDPRQNKGARLISEVSTITEAMEANSRSRGSSMSSGGMFTKLVAARMTMANGIPMVIASSDERDAVRRIAGGEKLGTFFIPHRESYAPKRQWLAVGSEPRGSLTVDVGAEEALLRKGKSLLPSGVVRADGEFEVGDVVSIRGLSGRELARGIVNYTCDETRKIMGRHSSEIAGLLGSCDYEELVHRNNMALLESS